MHGKTDNYVFHFGLASAKSKKKWMKTAVLNFKKTNEQIWHNNSAYDSGYS